MKSGSRKCNYCGARFYVKGIRIELFDWIGIGEYACTGAVCLWKN